MKPIFGAAVIVSASLFFISPSLYGADQSVTVKQLTQFIQSSVKQKFPDKEVAQYVSHMKLAERLDDQMIETLQGEGIGPKTVAALKALGASTSTLAAPVAAAEPPKAVVIPPPSYEDEQEIIRDITEYALNYTKRLPNFLCTQVTRRAAQPRGRDGWINVDTVVAKVSYQDGHENYEVKLVNNTVETKSMEQLNGSISTGEFGSMMYQVFDPQSGAEFHFERWGKLRGRIMYVYNYAIEQSRSRYSIDYEHKMHIITAYRGLIYVDKASRTISRITAEAVDIPADFPVRAARERLDYDKETIGTRDYTVPIVAEMNLGSADVMFRNTIEFRAYRVFGTDTQIKYDDIPDPIDPSRTKEEPAKPEPPK